MLWRNRTQLPANHRVRSAPVHYGSITQAMAKSTPIRCRRLQSEWRKIRETLETWFASQSFFCFISAADHSYEFKARAKMMPNLVEQHRPDTQKRSVSLDSPSSCCFFATSSY